ncbi:MAG: hypothetical protein M3Q80_00730 [bacterium]|nr:hypothetical protein [bacterium]
MISPLIQHDFVTKKEFNEFKGEVLLRFDAVDQRFDGVDKRFNGVDQRFDGIDKRFDSVDKRFLEIKSDMYQFKEEIKADFAHNIAVMREGFRDELKITNEYLEYIKQAVQPK